MGEVLGVSTEREGGSDSRVYEVGEIFEIQACPMFGAVLKRHLARKASFSSESRPLRENAGLDQAGRDIRAFPLEKSNDERNRLDVTTLSGQHVGGFRGERAPLLTDETEHLAQA